MFENVQSLESARFDEFTQTFIRETSPIMSSIFSLLLSWLPKQGEESLLTYADWMSYDLLVEETSGNTVQQIFLDRRFFFKGNQLAYISISKYPDMEDGLDGISLDTEQPGTDIVKSALGDVSLWRLSSLIEASKEHGVLTIEHDQISSDEMNAVFIIFTDTADVFTLQISFADVEYMNIALGSFSQ